MKNCERLQKYHCERLAAAHTQYLKELNNIFLLTINEENLVSFEQMLNTSAFLPHLNVGSSLIQCVSQKKIEFLKLLLDNPKVLDLLSQSCNSVKQKKVLSYNIVHHLFDQYHNSHQELIEYLLMHRAFKCICPIADNLVVEQLLNCKDLNLIKLVLKNKKIAISPHAVDDLIFKYAHIHRDKELMSFLIDTLKLSYTKEIDKFLTTSPIKDDIKTAFSARDERKKLNSQLRRNKKTTVISKL